MEEKRNAVRYAGRPREGSTLLLVTAVVWIALGVLGMILAEAAELGDYRQYPMQGVLCIGAIAAGVLLLAGRRSGQTWTVSLVVLTVASVVPGDKMALTTALFLALLSVRGFGFNRAPGFLPEPVRMPVLNLLSALLAILYGISGFSLLEKTYYISGDWVKLPGADAAGMVVLVLGLAAGTVLLNLSTEVRLVDPAARRQAEGYRVKSLPGQGALVTAGAVLLLLHLLELCLILTQEQYAGIYLSPISLLWALVLPAAGVLLLPRADRDRRALAAVILLTADGLYSIRSVGFLTGTDLLLAIVPPALMVAACIGTSWNRVPERLPALLRRPALSLGAAAVALVRLLLTLWNYLGREGHPDIDNIEILLYFLLALLTPAAIILLNLGMEARQAAPRQTRIDGEAYARGLAGVFQRFYGDVGGGLKLLAKIYGAICLVLFLLSALVGALGVLLLLMSLVDLTRMDGTSMILGGLVGMAASVILAVGSWPLYAFGQITGDIRDIRQAVLSGQCAGPAAPEYRTRSEGDRPAEENPDDLPEL